MLYQDMPLSSIRARVKYRQNEYKKQVNHPRVCPNYTQCNMYTSVQITAVEEQNTVY